MAKNENTKKRKIRTIIMDVCVKRATRSRGWNKTKNSKSKNVVNYVRVKILTWKGEKKITKKKEEKKDNIDVCVKNWTLLKGYMFSYPQEFQFCYLCSKNIVSLKMIKRHAKKKKK